MRSVWTLLVENVISLKLKRLEAVTNSVNYLGHVTRPRCWNIALHTSEDIRDLKLPTMLTALKWFLGLYSAICWVIRTVVSVAAPLIKQLYKSHRTMFAHLTQEETAAKNAPHDEPALAPVVNQIGRLVNTRQALTVAPCKLAVCSCKNEMTVQADKMDTSVALWPTQIVCMVRRTTNVKLHCVLYCF